MAFVKKSFNLDSETARRLDDFIDHNPHMSLTLVMTEALKMWLNNPKIEIKGPQPLTEEDVRRFNEENSELMEKLAE